MARALIAALAILSIACDRQPATLEGALRDEEIADKLERLLWTTDCVVGDQEDDAALVVTIDIDGKISVGDESRCPSRVFDFECMKKKFESRRYIKPSDHVRTVHVVVTTTIPLGDHKDLRVMTRANFERATGGPPRTNFCASHPSAVPSPSH